MLNLKGLTKNQKRIVNKLTYNHNLGIYTGYLTASEGFWLMSHYGLMINFENRCSKRLDLFERKRSGNCQRYMQYFDFVGDDSQYSLDSFRPSYKNSIDDPLYVIYWYVDFKNINTFGLVKLMRSATNHGGHPNYVAKITEVLNERGHLRPDQKRALSKRYSEW